MSERTGYEPGVPSWLDLTTTDPGGAMTFYEALFGWDLDRGGEDTGRYTMCRIGGRRVAGINGQPGPAGMPPAWFTYIATDDVDATAKRLTDAGGQIFMGPMDVTDQGRLMIGSDPQGAMIGFWEAREHTGAELVNEPGGMSWNELATTDLDGAQTFYGAVCGYTFENVDTGEQGPAYRTMHVDGQAVAGMLDMAGFPEGVPPHWMPYFAVADTDQAVTKVTELGGQVHVPPMDSPFGRWATVTDPQGAAFTILTLPEGGER